jgi:lysophospholipase L1-like esterase
VCNAAGNLLQSQKQQRIDKMKNIMFLGDSLTAGNIGASYLEVLKAEKKLTMFNLINAGENGFTMAGLQLKLESYLKENNAPETLVLEAGANDLLLPHMQKSGSAWNPFLRKLKRHGSTPASSACYFRRLSSAILSTALDGGITQVYVCTIPCLGENLDTELNKHREEYNEILRDLCLEYSNDLFNCICLDAALEVETILAGSRSNWLFSSPEELQHDAQIIKEKGEEILCRERNLLLTIDGAHLNQRGARVLSSLIIKYLRENLTLL